MDPNEALQAALCCLAIVAKGDRGKTLTRDYRDEAIERLRSLADWLESGGFAPNIARGYTRSWADNVFTLPERDVS